MTCITTKRPLILTRLVSACLTCICVSSAVLGADIFHYQQEDGPRFTVTPKGLVSVKLDGRVVGRTPYGWKYRNGGDITGHKLEVVAENHARVTHRHQSATVVYDFTFDGEDATVRITVVNRGERADGQLKFEGLWLQGFGGPPRMVHYHWDEDGRTAPHSSRIEYVIRKNGPKEFFPGGDSRRIRHGSAIAVGKSHGVGLTPWNLEAEGMPPTMINLGYGNHHAGVNTTYRRLDYRVWNKLEPGDETVLGLRLRFSRNNDWRHLVQPYKQYYNIRKGDGAFARDHRRMLPHVGLKVYPSLNKIQVEGKPGRYHNQLAAPDATVNQTANLTLQTPDDEVLWSGSIKIGERAVHDIPDWREGTATFAEHWPELGATFERPVPLQSFVWEGNKVGITDEVLPPFKEIQRTDDEVAVVMRRYHQQGLGLWSSVRAKGNDPGSEYRELLAAPMRLVANGQAVEGQGRFTVTAAHEAVYEGAVRHPAATIRTRCTTEYDGCLKVELMLRPTDPSDHALKTLILEIPLREDAVPLWHVVDTHIRGNPAGRTPAGSGEIWNSTANYAVGRRKDIPDFRGNFLPYVWLGGAERGLCWFADNDAGWVRDYENNLPALTLHRDNGVVTLRVHLVQKPTTLAEDRTIVFGLMATPAKPMPKNWRNILLRNMWQYAGKRPGYRQFDWLGSQYWGSYESFACKYPRQGDLSGLDEILLARQTGKHPDPHGAANAWVERIWGEPKKGKYTKTQLRNLLKHSIRRAAMQTLPEEKLEYFGGYWDEFIFTSYFHPESKVYQQEWDGTDRNRWGALFSTGLVDSYRDFATYWGKQFVSRGMGLYFDNTWPERFADPLTSSAYYLPDGRVQPTAGIWARRKYLKRIWLMHRLHEPRDALTLMTLHMTNSHVAPYMVWADSNLDLEWRYKTTPRQKAFPPDLLRAESLGLQTGNIPQSLAKNRAELSHFGTLMVHEVRSWFTHKTARRMLTQMLDFGYGKDAEVVNYWDDEPPIHVSDPRCKWLLMRKQDTWMILFCTWNSEPATVGVDIPEKDLPATPQQAVNLETDETTAIETGRFSFEMPAYGTRLFVLQP